MGVGVTAGSVDHGEIHVDIGRIEIKMNIIYWELLCKIYVNKQDYGIAMVWDPNRDLKQHMDEILVVWDRHGLGSIRTRIGTLNWIEWNGILGEEMDENEDN